MTKPPFRATHYVRVLFAPDGREQELETALVGTELHTATGRAVATIDEESEWRWIGRGAIQRIEVRARPGSRPRGLEVTRPYAIRFEPRAIEAFQRAAGARPWREWLVETAKKAAGIE